MLASTVAAPICIPTLTWGVNTQYNIWMKESEEISMCITSNTDNNGVLARGKVGQR